METAAKLRVPSFFIDQVFRDEPVPDHILEEIERQVGPIRLTKSDFSANTLVTKQNARVPTEAEISLEDFVRNCGGLLAASLKLGVSTTTIQKLLSGLPVSLATTKKVFRALSELITCTKSEDHFLSLPGLIPLGGISPSTIRKILEGRPISSRTQLKLGIQPDEDKPDAIGMDSTSVLTKRLRELAKSDADVFDLSSKFGVTETPLKKILEGKLVSRPLIQKLRKALDLSPQGKSCTKPSAAAERLYTIHNLYKQLGTLDAVGKQVGLTRERIRQLLSKGKKFGLFEYNPREYPFISREKILEDYKKAPNLSRVAQLNNIDLPPEN